MKDKSQPELFEQTTPSDKAIKESDDFHWRQFVKLGDMMADGLHHEKDGKWIVREYNQLAKILIPDLREKQKQIRKSRSKNINEQMQKLLIDNKCSCGGKLYQGRSGSKVCYCIQCNSRYIFTKKKGK